MSGDEPRRPAPSDAMKAIIEGFREDVRASERRLLAFIAQERDRAVQRILEYCAYRRSTNPIGRLDGERGRLPFSKAEVERPLFDRAPLQCQRRPQG